MQLKDLIFEDVAEAEWSESSPVAARVYVGLPSDGGVEIAHIHGGELEFQWSVHQFTLNSGDLFRLAEYVQEIEDSHAKQHHAAGGQTSV